MMGVGCQGGRFFQIKLVYIFVIINSLVDLKNIILIYASGGTYAVNTKIRPS